MLLKDEEKSTVDEYNWKTNKEACAEKTSEKLKFGDKIDF